jgi:hypothetical protein
MSTIQQMIQQMKTPVVPPMQPQEIYLPPDSPKKKREWKVTDLGGDFSHANIISQLKSDEYLHKSSKQVRLLFRVLGKQLEEEYLSVQ